MTSEPAAAAGPSLVGHCIDERYRLEAEIGVGGLGTVYRAMQTKLQRAVAVKLLHESYGGNAVQRGRFEREARALATIEHSNIVSVLDYGVSEDRPYLVMELLEGETLSQHLKRGPLPIRNAVSIAQQMLSALAFMHSGGLVHRDLKPSNVFLQRLTTDRNASKFSTSVSPSSLHRRWRVRIPRSRAMARSSVRPRICRPNKPRAKWSTHVATYTRWV